MIIYDNKTAFYEPVYKIYLFINNQQIMPGHCSLIAFTCFDPII